MMTDAAAFTRSKMLARISAAEARVLAAARAVRTEDHQEAMATLGLLYDLYEEGLERPVLARCPLTGDLFAPALDTGGFDGPWWSYARAIRPVESHPETLVGFTGAVALPDPAPMTAFEVRPGPGLPFVLPRRMQIEGMKAVIRQLAIGGDAAWSISYFHRDLPADIPTLNQWGMDQALITLSDGQVLGFDLGPEWDVVDFDIGPWIERGQLMWMAEDDPEHTLRPTAFDCPYIGLESPRDFVALAHGRAIPIPAVQKDKSA